MSNAFTNFLGGVVSGVFGTGPIMKDFQHANRVYVQNNYARAPKLGFLYFVAFNINDNALPAIYNSNPQWVESGKRDIGFLVKRIDLPRFSISADTINQYNRKSIVQNSIKYNPISLELHDDNSNITRDFWKAYFQYYYADSTHGIAPNGRARNAQPVEFTNTKYSTNNYAYGLNSSQTAPFLESVDIYVLHQQRFTQYTLVNPLITDWNHDSLDQADGGKILTNKMTFQYETVRYREGQITKASPEGFAATYYDASPSPLSVAGNGTNTVLGPGGVISGANAVLGALGQGNILGAAILGANVARNARQISKAGLKQEGYSILTGVLGDVQANANQPGGVGAAVQSGINQRGIGVNLFSGSNTSVNGTTQATQVKTIK
jgi:hypothetical protein